MTDTGRSRTEVMRQGIVDAAREAALLLVAGDAGERARACAERARTLATELKALSRRMGSAEGHDEAVRLLAMIEELQARLEPAASPDVQDGKRNQPELS